MKNLKMCGIFVATTLLFVVFSLPATGQEPWWPSRYGADDELGTLNEITPAKVLEAMKYVGNGQVYSLGTEYRRENPGFVPRFWETTALAHRTVTPLGNNKFVWLEEEFTGCPGVGTQIDGLAHVGVEYAPGDIRFYNGRKLMDVIDVNKALLKRWGMDSYPQVVTRGVLADMVAFYGRELNAGDPISAADVQECLKRQGVEALPGDALLIRTGWFKWFKEDPKKFIGGEPGITVDVVDWAYEKKIAFLGFDQWSSEVVPMVDSEEKWPVHCEAIAKRGFTWGQNLDMESLAKDKVYEFLFAFTFPKIEGLTQGIGNPIAIGRGPSPKEAPFIGEEPKGKQWWPSRYGEKDELGTLNELTSAKVVEAAALVKHGKIFDMGTSYGSKNPGFPPRFWHSTTLAHRVLSPLGKNKFVWLEEQFSGCPGVGTQTDNPAHVGIEYEPGDIRFYNGFTLEEVLNGSAMAVKFQDWPPIVTRGVLADMASFYGRELDAGDPVSAKDIQDCLARQGVDVKPGDALLVRTGWMRWFTEDPAKFMSGEPGITADVIEWAYEKRLSFIAVDQWSSEVVPMVDSEEKWPVHCEAIAKRGFTWGQDFDMEALAEDCKTDTIYEFLFIDSCPKITGITQGISAPIAIK